MIDSSFSFIVIWFKNNLSSNNQLEFIDRLNKYIKNHRKQFISEIDWVKN